ncbi:MAG: hypothetical protein Q7R68_11200 [Nitrospirales bacterium]|nr:hypothetical protein [Nitrospirales bacterium]
MTPVTRRGLLKGLLGLTALSAIGPVLPAVLPVAAAVPALATVNGGLTLAHLRKIACDLQANAAPMLDEGYFIGHYESFRFITANEFYAPPPRAGGLRFTKDGAEVNPREYFGPDRVWRSTKEHALDIL